jgi:hypothetical protein
MSKEIPTPRIFSGFEAALLPFDIDWTNFVEASELTGSPRSSLQPDNQRNRLIFNGEVEALPKGVIHRGRAFGIIPIDIFVASERLIVNSGAYFSIIEISGIGNRVMSRYEENRDESKYGELK